MTWSVRESYVKVDGVLSVFAKFKDRLEPINSWVWMDKGIYMNMYERIR